MSNIKLSSKYDLMIQGAIAGGVEYLREHPKVEALVLGVSGGVDSALVAYLASEVVKRVGRKVQLIGRVLPIITNEEDEIARACAVGKAFCDEYELVDLSETYGALAKVILGSTPDEPDHMFKVRAGNLKARTRMTYLYDLAQKHRGMVLSTDNFTELQLGFWTLHGDVGDFGLIQELWKTEVYGVAESVGGPLTPCVEAKPTDGLGVSNSDIDQLLPGWQPSAGKTWRDAYREVDDILIGFLTGEADYNETHPVIARHLATHFKRKAPVNLKREFLLWPYNAVA